MKRIWIRQHGETTWKPLCFIHRALEEYLYREEGYEYQVEDVSDQDFILEK